MINMQIESLIEINNLKFSYNKQPVLDIESLNVSGGKIVGLLGPNGAGKTTLIKILTGFLSIPKNAVKIIGIDVHKNASIKRKLGVVPQENNLYLKMSAFENLNLHAQLFDVPKDQVKTRIEDWLKKVDLNERKKENVENFSGGMQRRVTFIRALLHDPEIIILDEPTNGLDPQTRILLWDWIKKLRDQGKLIFLTTHHIDEAEKLCDEVIIIDHGKILEHSTPKECKQKYVGNKILSIETTTEESELRQLLPSYEIEKIADESFIVYLKQNDDSTDVINLLNQNKIPFSNFSIKETSLEEVFIKLTGRGLRE